MLTYIHIENTFRDFFPHYSRERDCINRSRTKTQNSSHRLFPGRKTDPAFSLLPCAKTQLHDVVNDIGSQDCFVNSFGHSRNINFITCHNIAHVSQFIDIQNFVTNKGEFSLSLDILICRTPYLPQYIQRQTFCSVLYD